MTPENEDIGSMPTIAALARSLGGVAASVAQTLVRGAGEMIAWALGAVVKSQRDGSRADRRAEPGLRAIVGGAAVRAHRKQEIGRAEGAPTPNQESATGALDDDGALLDAELDEDEMVVLPRDPQSLYAYWHLGEATRARREELLQGGAGLLHDALLVEADGDDLHGGATGAESWVVSLPLRAESCHVDLGRPRVRARLSLGLHTEGSGFTPLAESPAVSLPPRGYGDVAEPRWRLLPFRREHAGAPPTAPRREVSDLLVARASEHDRGSSQATPRVDDAAGQHRSAAVGRTG